VCLRAPSDTILPMVIWLCFRWWYGDGWQWAMKRAIADRVIWCNETFSILTMIRTLFAPFKQTSSSGNTLDLKIHAFVDNIVSRGVGFVSRSFLIFVGLLAVLFSVITGIVFLALWPLAPFSLLISLALMVFGVGR
jgi:hypothetical protein